MDPLSNLLKKGDRHAHGHEIRGVFGVDPRASPLFQRSSAAAYGTLDVSNRSLFSVMELEIVLLAKKVGITQLLLLTGTATATVTWLVSLVIVEGVTLTVASWAEIELSTT